MSGAASDIAHLLDAARHIAGAVRYWMAVTAGRDGEANARVVQFSALDDDWRAAFFTSRSSRKAAEIERAGRLTLACQHDAEGAYLSLVGRAALDGDFAAKQALWSPGTERWFPRGASDPDAVLVRFTAERLELWSRAAGIMPPPKGLRAAVLVRAGEGAWRVAHRTETSP